MTSMVFLRFLKKKSTILRCSAWPVFPPVIAWIPEYPLQEPTGEGIWGRVKDMKMMIRSGFMYCFKFIGE
jgi:hypothetical protein